VGHTLPTGNIGMTSAFGLLVASYVLILGSASANLVLRVA
jgi:hypothetical protein